MQTTKPWILKDGQWMRDGNIISSDNRSFLYGDGLFETIRVVNAHIPFLKLHIERLQVSMRVLKFEIIEDLSIERVSKHIEQLLIKNKWFKGARIRLTIYRKADGKYTPANNQTGYILTGEPLVTEPVFPFRGMGRIMGIYSDLLKSDGILSTIKTTSSIYYVLAGSFARQNGYDDVFVLNQRKKIIETVNSNILLIKGKTIIAPGPKFGALDGTMRKMVLRIAMDSGFEVFDRELTEQDVLMADELMLTNAIQGINWVKGFRDRRYYSNVGAEFSRKLNETIG
jgi:branched-chain amino acid aminotransferase